MNAIKSWGGNIFGEQVHSYCIAGLSVDSEIALPGVITGQVIASSPEVTIRHDFVPLSIENASSSGPTWQMAGDQFLLHIPGVARFLLTSGRDIAFELENDTTPEDIAIFLAGTVFGILLHQRGQIVLHASAVRVNGKAVLFCGVSGAGKSTLAAALGQRGYPLVTDDVCAIISMDTGILMVQPDGRQLKLWAHAIENLGLGGCQGASVRNRLEKYYVEPVDAFVEPLVLGAVYALREARPPHRAGIEQPNVVDAALVLRRNAYRPLLVNRMGQKASYFLGATKIANAAGIFYLTRALDFSATPEVISWLEQHWLETGLVERAE